MKAGTVLLAPGLQDWCLNAGDILVNSSPQPGTRNAARTSGLPGWMPGLPLGSGKYPWRRRTARHSGFPHGPLGSAAKDRPARAG